MKDPFQHPLERAEQQVRFANRFVPFWKQEEHLRENLLYLQGEENEEEVIAYGEKALRHVPGVWWDAIVSSPVDLFVVTAGYINRVDIQLEHQSRFRKGLVLTVYLFALFVTSSNLIAAMVQVGLFPAYLIGETDWNTFWRNLALNLFKGIGFLALLILHAKILKLQDRESTLFRMMNRLEPKKTPRGLSHLDRVLGWTAKLARSWASILFGVFTHQNDKNVIQRIKDQFKPR